jgi:hypothetical protein
MQKVASREQLILFGEEKEPKKKSSAKTSSRKESVKRKV